MVILIGLMFSNFAYAKKKNEEGGHTSGGGGGGLLCSENGKTKLFALDYFEAKMRFFNPKDMRDVLPEKYKAILEKDEPVGDEGEKAIDSMFQVDAMNALSPLPMLKQKILSYYYRVNLLGDTLDADLSDYKDSGIDFEIPKNCKYVQIIVRDEDAFKINFTLLKQLNENQLAILFLHEVIYFAIKQNNPEIKNSRFVRQIIGKLISIMYGVDRDGRLNNHDAYFKLCNLAEKFGLCKVDYNNFSKRVQDEYSLVFWDYVKDLTHTIDQSKEEYLSLESTDVISILTSSKQIPVAKNEFEESLKLSENKIFTVSVLTKAVGDYTSNVVATGCFDQSVPKAMTKICDYKRGILLLTLKRLVNGYTKKYCVMKGKEPRCLDETSVPGINFEANLNDQVWKFVDQSDLDTLFQAIFNVPLPEVYNVDIRKWFTAQKNQ